MRSALTIWALFSGTAAFGGESMKVAVCSLSQIPGQVIEHAEAEVSYVFRSMDVEITWTEYAAFDASDPHRRPDFLLRLQVGGQITKAGPVSLEAMGRAFIDSDGSGFMADAYYGAVRDLTVLFPLTTSSQLLGYVITHELGPKGAYVVEIKSIHLSRT